MAVFVVLAVISFIVAGKLRSNSAWPGFAAWGAYALSAFLIVLAWRAL